METLCVKLYLLRQPYLIGRRLLLYLKKYKEIIIVFKNLGIYNTDLLHFFCKSNPPYLMTHLPIKELPITTTFLSLATSAILLASLTDLN